MTLPQQQQEISNSTKIIAVLNGALSLKKCLKGSKMEDYQ